MMHDGRLNNLDLGGLLDMTTTTKTPSITVSFNREKETPGTVRYTEDVQGEEKLIGVLYVQKNTAARLGNPETLTVTLLAGTPGMGA